LIGTVIPDFGAIAAVHGLNTAIGRSAVLPMIIRLRLLAGLAIVMKNPLEQLSRLRQSRAFGPQFDRVLAQDPIGPQIVAANPSNLRIYATRYQVE
jgi:hypothetical protein